jgi:dimethylargininase
VNGLIAVTHLPSPAMQACERTFVAPVAIDYQAARRQFSAYGQALQECGCEVRTLSVNLRFPDSAFIEDTAIVLDEVAVCASMGVESRRGETPGIAAALRGLHDWAQIELPATIEGGDVLRVGHTILVGISGRTNAAGLEALSAITAPFGYRLQPVSVRQCLHLKTACTALPDGCLLANPAWVAESDLEGFKVIRVPAAEPWGANVLSVRGTVLVADAHPQTAELVCRLGFPVKTVELTEFAKAEGGATCLSLLFPRSAAGRHHELPPSQATP